MPFNFFLSWSSDPTITSDPLHGLWERPKIENLNLFLSWSKCIHMNLKGITIAFKQKSNAIYRPHGCIFSLKWLFLVKNGIFFTFGCCGVPKILQSFRLILIYFDHCKNKIQNFNFAFSICFIGGLR